jgi:hypothetical protein
MRNSQRAPAAAAEDPPAAPAQGWPPLTPEQREAAVAPGTIRRPSYRRNRRNGVMCP